MKNCALCCGADKRNGAGICMACGDTWGEFELDQHEGMGVIAWGCLAFVALGVGVVWWLLGGAP